MSSETLPSFLAALELSPAAQERDVRRSYAQRLKQIDQEADPRGFQALRDAYEAALNWVRSPREEPMFAPPVMAPVMAPEVARADPSATAQEMLHALSHSMVAQPLVNLRMAQDRLHAALDDPRLLDLDARWMFEGGIAVLIAEGWQPGHQFLVPAAIEIFRWRVEHSRLQGFGRAGQVVDGVVTELDLYEQHAPDLRLSLDKVMRLLRGTERPEVQFLMTHMQFVEHIARAYPHLVHVITNPRNIQQWREWEAQAIAARPAPAPEKPQHWLMRIVDRRPGLILLAMLALAFVLLLFTAPKAPERPVAGAPAGMPAAGAPGAAAPHATTNKPRTPADVAREQGLKAGMEAISAAMAPAQYKRPPAVDYPAASQRLGETGKALIRVMVRRDGAPGEVEVFQTSGHDKLDRAALDGVRGASFVPARGPDGQPINAWFIVPINFTQDRK
ncbi:energy transducer TonB [Variovorax sp. dw_954]|uniref:energy transducer TonB n=1 Tax=Variovorax sp. dw_954 TaxID=2720078 RepID=UPI001BD3CBAA|nr:energy transducer TonB [Variovorax sp. dw_954]